jgi:hypothetical protein
VVGATRAAHEYKRAAGPNLVDGAARDLECQQQVLGQAASRFLWRASGMARGSRVDVAPDTKHDASETRSCAHPFLYFNAKH